MQEFAMMVGLPGSGKDTFIKTNSYFDNFIIVSTDQVRKEKGYRQGEIRDVFTICRKQIIDSLTLGKNVAFNATNLHRRYRMNLLDELHNKFYDIEYNCYVMTTPIKVCKEWNAKRIGFDMVPNRVIDKMACGFEIPIEREGFNNIYFCQNNWRYFCDKNDKIKYKYISADYSSIYEFNQDNPFHTLSLGDHMDKTYDYVVDNIEKYFNEQYTGQPKYLSILEAALWHDIGKLVTKDYHDRKGNKTEIAHYYGHENIGAYLILSEFPYLNFFDIDEYEYYVKIATYINFHMRISFTWRNYPNGKCAKREKKLFNDFDLQCLELLGEADRQAH